MLLEMSELFEAVLEQKADGRLVLLDKWALREAVARVLDQLPKINHEAPRIGSEALESLKQDSANLLLDCRLALFVKLAQDKAKVVGVRIGVSQLVDN